MKKYIALLLCFALCISLAACGGSDNPTISEEEDLPPSSNASSGNDSSSNESSSDASSNNSSDSSIQTPASGSGSTFVPEKMDPSFNPKDEAECYKVDFNSWQMYLANPWNRVPDSWLNLTTESPELAKVDQKYRPNPAVNTQLYFDARAADYLHAMIAAAEKDGVNLDVISAYRTNTFQTMNFNNQVTSVKNANPGISEEDAKAKAATVVALPGTSEHQLGLAVDFNSVEDSFRNTTAYKWLIENCTDYGFILRYDVSKQDKTGIIPEPWHYRYVGVKNAKLIEASGLCLEEFIEKYSKPQ